MDVVLEIGKRDIRIGVVEELDPIIIPISYKHTGESNYLSDHSLTKDQYQSIISQLDETNQIKLQQYNESLGTWIDIELISPMILQKLLFDVIDSIPVNIKRCFLIDYGFSQKLKQTFVQVYSNIELNQLYLSQLHFYMPLEVIDVMH